MLSGRTHLILHFFIYTLCHLSFWFLVVESKKCCTMQVIQLVLHSINVLFTTANSLTMTKSLLFMMELKRNMPYDLNEIKEEQENNEEKAASN